MCCLSRRLILALALGVAVLPGKGAFAQCITINVYDPEAFDRGKTISVGLFSMEGGAVNPNFGPLETPRQVLLESLEKSLRKSKFFSSVAVIAADSGEVSTDYLLLGEILGVEGGSRGRRILVGGYGSAGKMRINGRLLGPLRDSGEGQKTRPMISDYECNALDMGGWSGLGSNETAIRKNAEKTADSISKAVFKQVDKKTDDLIKKSEKNQDKQPIKGSSEAKNRKWREKQEWEPDDYVREIESFVVRSERKDERGVDALWLTQSVHTAHERLLPVLRQTAVLNSREIKRGMLTEIEPIERFRGEDVYVVALTFNVSVEKAPFLWDSEEIRKLTHLTREDDPGVRVAPLAFLDQALRSYVVFRERKILKGLSDFWAFHPVVAVFPTRTADGQPLVRGVEDHVQLSTVVNGRPAQLTFDLRHFDLRSLDELKINPPRPAQ